MSTLIATPAEKQATVKPGAQPFIVVPSMIIARDNHILLIKRGEKNAYHPNNWHCPTGMLEPGETPEQGVIRETFEEVGTATTGVRLASMIMAYRPHHPRWQFQFWMFFIAEHYSPEPFNKEPHKHPELGWFSVDNLPQPLIPMVADGIKLWRAGQLYGEFHYTI